jgi:hypothetical protein
MSEQALRTPVRSQHVSSQHRKQGSQTSIAQQQGRLLRRPVGIEAGIAAIVLAALGLSLALGFAAQNAVCIRNGYTAMALRRDIEELRASNALLRYQVNLTGSAQRVQQAAERLSLRPADPIKEVDYVALPADAVQGATAVASADTVKSPGALSAVLATLATEVGRTRGEAEASTGTSHRQ